MHTEAITRVAKRYAPHIKVKKLDSNTLINAALKDFRKRHPGQPTTVGAPGHVLAFIRHNLTNYDELMDSTRENKEHGYVMRDALRLAVLFAAEREYGHIPGIRKEIAKKIENQKEMIH